MHLTTLFLTALPLALAADPISVSDRSTASPVSASAMTSVQPGGPLVTSTSSRLPLGPGPVVISSTATDSASASGSASSSGSTSGASSSTPSSGASDSANVIPMGSTGMSTMTLGSAAGATGSSTGSGNGAGAVGAMGGAELGLVGALAWAVGAILI